MAEKYENPDELCGVSKAANSGRIATESATCRAAAASEQDHAGDEADEGTEPSEADYTVYADSAPAEDRWMDGLLTSVVLNLSTNDGLAAVPP